MRLSASELSIDYRNHLVGAGVPRVYGFPATERFVRETDESAEVIQDIAA